MQRTGRSLGLDGLECIGPRGERMHRPLWRDVDPHSLVKQRSRLSLRGDGAEEIRSRCPVLLHRPPPGLASGEPDDRLRRTIQYSVTPVIGRDSQTQLPSLRAQRRNPAQGEESGRFRIAQRAMADMLLRSQ
jgi:hypothetical protein